jgi:uncharacterized protein (DUF362 family)
MASLAPLSQLVPSSLAADTLLLKRGDATAPISGPGYVVRVHMPGMRGRFSTHPEAARIMVREAVTALTGVAKPSVAWRRIIRPMDRVGIKVNLSSGRLFGTSREVVYAVVEELLSIPLPPENIMIFDRAENDMTAAGFRLEKGPEGVKIVSSDKLGYEKRWINVAGVEARFSRTLIENTAIIHIPVLGNLAAGEDAGTLKTLILGAVAFKHATNRQVDEILPLLYSHEAIRGRVRLTIADGSICRLGEGSADNLGTHVTHDSIYATTDPVALDRIAQEVINSLRKKNGLQSLTKSDRPAKLLESAARLGLGVADRRHIHLETVRLPRFSGSAA